MFTERRCGLAASAVLQLQGSLLSALLHRFHSLDWSGSKARILPWSKVPEGPSSSSGIPSSSCLCLPGKVRWPRAGAHTHHGKAVSGEGSLNQRGPRHWSNLPCFSKDLWNTNPTFTPGLGGRRRKGSRPAVGPGKKNSHTTQPGVPGLHLGLEVNPVTTVDLSEASSLRS